MQEIGGLRPIYDPTAVQPMRDELVQVGVRELKTAADVDTALENAEGTTLLVINSVCGCAAGGARPGVMLALQNDKIPNDLTTVFAGQDREATDKARSYLAPLPPSSPFVALFKDGKPIFALQRHDIETRNATQIAQILAQAFSEHCERQGPSIPREELEKMTPFQACGSTIPKLDEPST